MKNPTFDDCISPVPNLLIGHLLNTTGALPISQPAHLPLKCGMHSGRQGDWERVRKIDSNQNGILVRTDEIDFRTITLYGLERQLQKWDPPSEFISCLKELRREVNDLNEQVAMIKNRLHAKKHSHKPDQLVIKRLKD